AVFTKKFNDLGFHSNVYVDTSDLEDVTDYPLMMMPTELVQNRRCPIFKRKLFFNLYEEFMEASCGQAAVEFWEYLTQKTDYDVNLIWDNLLRTANMHDLKQRMQLNYILQRAGEPALAEADIPSVALFAHFYYPDMLPKLLPSIEAMPAQADLYFTTDTEEKAAQIRGFMRDRACTIKVIGNRGREYAGFLMAMKTELMAHDVAVILHGKKSHYDKPYLNGDSFLYHCIENTAPTAAYVRRVLALFQNNPRLGLLVPPTPSHGLYYPILGREWGENFENTQALCKQLGVEVPMSKESPPVAPLGGFFWFRTKALQGLFAHEWSAEDFPEEPCTAQDGTVMHALERCYPFVAQQAGYYSAWLMSDRFAAMLVTNQVKTLRDINISCCPQKFNLTYFKLLDQIRMLFLNPEYTHGMGKRMKMAAKLLMGSRNAERLMLLKGKIGKKLHS
ncbi:MAG: rhamnan synthesis F family protein, partial [Clostridia bacterium]